MERHDGCCMARARRRKCWVELTMRILVISDLPEFVTGGAEMQAARLIECWVSLGHEVVCLGRRMGASNTILGKHQIRTSRITTLQYFGRPGRAISYFLSLCRELMRHRHWADVIYCRFLGDAAITVALCKSVKLLNIPLVPTPACSGEHGDISFLRSLPYSSWLIDVLDRKCNAINLIAPQMEHDLRHAGFSKTRLSRIPNGIPITAIRPRHNEGSLRAVCVGRLTAQKGYDILIDALALRPDLEGKLIIDVIGDGPEHNALIQRAARLPVGMLNFVGELAPSFIHSALQAADLFILPSRYEGLSNAALEAMERGLPILLTRCGGIDSYIDERMGWVTAPGDSIGLAAALGEACDCSRVHLNAMGKMCRSIVEQEFEMGGVATRYITLFNELINENHCGHS